MEKIIVFGTGEGYHKNKDLINPESLICFLDNDEEKQGKILDGRPIVAPVEINHLDYDRVIIASIYVNQIKEQLRGLGVQESKIQSIYSNDIEVDSDKQIELKINKIRRSTVKKKLVIISENGNDHFIKRFYKLFGMEYEVTTFKLEPGNAKKYMQEILELTDICFFEWAGPLLRIAASKSNHHAKIICRIHAYEVYGSSLDILSIKWNNVHKIIFIADHIRQYFLQKTHLKEEQTQIIYNGFNTEEWTYKNRKKGYNIGFIGNLNDDKGINLLLQIAKQLVERNKKYKIFLIGNKGREEVFYYMEHMIRELGLGNNFIYEGYTKDVDSWLEDKQYIICTSVSEGHITAIQEAMLKGIKPIIHNYRGAKELYPQKYIWNSIEEACAMIEEESYESIEYKECIKSKLDIMNIVKQYKVLFDELIK